MAEKKGISTRQKQYIKKRASDELEELDLTGKIAEIVFDECEKTIKRGEALPLPLPIYRGLAMFDSSRLLPNFHVLLLEGDPLEYEPNKEPRTFGNVFYIGLTNSNGFSSHHFEFYCLLQHKGVLDIINRGRFPHPVLRRDPRYESEPIRSRDIHAITAANGEYAVRLSRRQITEIEG